MEANPRLIYDRPLSPGFFRRRRGGFYSLRLGTQRSSLMGNSDTRCCSLVNRPRREIQRRRACSHKPSTPDCAPFNQWAQRQLCCRLQSTIKRATYAFAVCPLGSLPDKQARCVYGLRFSLFKDVFAKFGRSIPSL